MKERASNRGYTYTIGGANGKYGNNQSLPALPLAGWRKNISQNGGGFDYAYGGSNNATFTTFNRVRR